MNAEIKKRVAIKRAGWLADNLAVRYGKEHRVEVFDDEGICEITIICSEGNFIALHVSGEDWESVNDSVKSAEKLFNYMDFEDKRKKGKRKARR